MRTRTAAVLCALVFSWLAYSPATAGTAAAAGPRAVVEQAVVEVLAVLGDASLQRSQRLRRIEEVAYAHFDFATMSKLVLARSWRRFSPDQQVEFIAEFKGLLSRRYGSRLDRYSEEGVDITGEKQEARGDVTVLTEVVGGGFEGATINYRMRKTAESWKAIDVVVEGVSLVSSYRTQFRDLLGDGSPALVLERMREKNAAPPDEDEED